MNGVMLFDFLQSSVQVAFIVVQVIEVSVKITYLLAILVK